MNLKVLSNIDAASFYLVAGVNPAYNALVCIGVKRTVECMNEV